jgi:DNA-binding transcriptional ArsR family regulator
MPFAPSLWRTCRALANRKRLACLRAVVGLPDRPVKVLAARAALAQPVASAYLRQLQARGVIAARRDGRWVRYQPRAEPTVAHAAPVLAALRRALSRGGARDGILLRRLAAFTHSRRLRLLRALRADADTDFAVLQQRAPMPKPALVRHLRKLAASGVARRTDRGWRLAPRPPAVVAALLHENAGIDG